MIWLTFLPAALTLILALALGLLPLPLHPVWAARVLVTVAGSAAFATIGTLVFVTVNYAATLFPHAAARLPEWALFGDDQPVHTALGAPAIVLAVLSMGTAARLAVRWTTEVRHAQDASRTVVDSDVPMAMAVPGRNGGVLVSRGLLRTLDRAQLQVVFQHEASHLRHRHHRYLVLGALAAGILPALRPLNARLRFALERWADEDAAEAVGDRRLVARTIAQVALARSPNGPGAAPFPAFTDSGVLRRVQALLGTAPAKNTITGPVILTGAGLIIGMLARLIKPGKQRLGIIATLLLGLAGSVIGGTAANLLGTGDIFELNVLGFIIAVVASSRVVRLRWGTQHPRRPRPGIPQGELLVEARTALQ